MKKRKKNRVQIVDILKEEEQLLKHEEIETKHIYKKLLEVEELLKKKQLRKFNDVLEWRQNIWEGCRYKKEKPTKKEIVYICKKRKGLCHFVDCPENKA